MVRQKQVFWQNLHAYYGCSASGIRSQWEMPRGFIWYVYCKDLLHSAGQERASCDSAPPRVAPLNSLKGHSSVTSWRGIIIQVSLDSQADGAARAGLPKSRPAVVGHLLLAFWILLGSGIKLPRT